MSASVKVTTTGKAVTLTWPEPDIALVTMTREREMNTLSLELLNELDEALTASVAGGGLNPDLVERPFSQHAPVGHAVERHATGQAKFLQTGQLLHMLRGT